MSLNERSLPFGAMPEASESWNVEVKLLTGVQKTLLVLKNPYNGKMSRRCDSGASFDRNSGSDKSLCQIPTNECFSKKLELGDERRIIIITFVLQSAYSVH